MVYLPCHNTQVHDRTCFPCWTALLISLWFIVLNDLLVLFLCVFISELLRSFLVHNYYSWLVTYQQLVNLPLVNLPHVHNYYSWLVTYQQLVNLPLVHNYYSWLVTYQQLVICFKQHSPDWLALNYTSIFNRLISSIQTEQNQYKYCNVELVRCS